MELSEPVTIEEGIRSRIYDFVEAHGTVSKDRVRRELLPPDPAGEPHHEREFRHHLAILKRDGYLEEGEDGQLRIALEVGVGEEEVTTDDATVTIRPARQDDLSGIVGAIRQVAEGMTYIVAESVADELDHENALLRHNELESRMFFVATVEEEVVGWAHLRIPNLEKLSHTAELTIGVVEGYRGNGIGSQLLDRALEWARRNDREKVYQSVPSTNDDAIEFFESRGWGVEAIREAHYEIDDEYIDEVMMATRL